MWLELGRPGHRETTRHNIESYILNATEIHARCALLFDFARGESAEVPSEPCVVNITSVLNLIGCVGGGQ
jgi:hypothetical protein